MLSGDRHESEAKSDSVLFHYLRNWQRWLVGLLALLMLGFCPYAILEGHDGLATSTLVLAGLVVSAIAITGVIPRRITYKDATIELMVQQRVQREVQVAVEEVADEVAESTDDWWQWSSSIGLPPEDASRDPWAHAPPPAAVFSRRLTTIRHFEDSSLAALQDYAQDRTLEVRQSDRAGEPDCFLTEPSTGFDLPVVFKHRWSIDSVTRISRFLMPRTLFICAQIPGLTELELLRHEKLGIQFAIVKAIPTMLDHAIADLRGGGEGRAIASRPGGGWYVSLPLDG